MNKIYTGIEILPFLQKGKNIEELDSQDTWQPLSTEKSWFELLYGDDKYRVQAEQISVNGIQFTAPMTEAPEEKTHVFVSDLMVMDLVTEFVWGTIHPETQDLYLRNGICHLEFRDALKQSKALLSVLNPITTTESVVVA